MTKIKILIVKFGALGDVVRTSYFARSLKEKYSNNLELSWVTSASALPLLINNPYIDHLSDSFTDFKNAIFNIIYSLDDEADIVVEVAKLQADKLSGAFFDGGKLTYTQDVSEWFDMGLLSTCGKTKADELKKLNQRSHSEIFQHIFQVESVEPNFFLDQPSKVEAEHFFKGSPYLLGINPYAGGRWPSKELRDNELCSLINLISDGRVFSVPVTIVLFGAAEDRRRNELLVERLGKRNICVADTDSSVLKLAGFISKMSLIISSDSLAMHIAIAQGIPTLAFFSPTSAVEIDSFGICEKLISTASDYCSYKKDCDNSTITAERLIDKLRNSDLFRPNSLKLSF